jgi:heat shock protein HslJ
MKSLNVAINSVNTGLLAIALILFVQCKSSQPQSEARLENTYWKLAEVEGKPVKTPDNGREVHMILTDADNQRSLKGFAGCNGLGGDYTVEDKKITFSTISTRMFCDLQMEVENAFLKALAEANTYSIKGEVLELYNNDTLLAKFESVYLK